MEVQSFQKKIVQQVLRLGVSTSIAIIIAPVAAYFIGKLLFGTTSKKNMKEKRKRSSKFLSVLNRSVTSLPVEIVFQISQFLDEQSLTRLSQTNKYLHDLVKNEESVWRNHFRERWPKKPLPQHFTEATFGDHYRSLGSLINSPITT